MEQIIHYLRNVSSAENPIKGRDIADHFGISGIDVRDAINKARRASIPICSSRFGYYYSEDKEDIKKTVESMRGRIVAQENAIVGLSALLS